MQRMQVKAKYELVEKAMASYVITTKKLAKNPSTLVEALLEYANNNPDIFNHLVLKPNPMGRPYPKGEAA